MRKTGLLAFLVLLLSIPSFAGHRYSSSHHSYGARTTGSCCSRRSSDVHVHGYTRRNGTYVRPYYRSHANGTQKDNFSTKGNVNPYTGRYGTKTPTH